MVERFLLVFRIGKPPVVTVITLVDAIFRTAHAPPSQTAQSSRCGPVARNADDRDRTESARQHPISTKVIIMLKRILLAIMLATCALGAIAADNTDIWYDPTEPGWGVNLVQSDNFIFATFFIYGQNGSPTWYTGQLTWDGVSAYTGGLFATTGTWFAAPWQAGNLSVVQAGTASFAPSSLATHRGTLSYTVNGVATVTKSIERQTLTAIVLGGSYTGGQSGTYSACANAADNRAYTDRYDLEVTQLAGGNATFEFTYSASLTCTLSGMLEQHGLQYRIPSGDLPVLGRRQYRSDAVRDQGDRAGNRGPHQRRFVGRRRAAKTRRSPRCCSDGR